MPPMLSNVQESSSKLNHGAGELTSVFFVTLFFVKTAGHLIKRPPLPQLNRHIIALAQLLYSPEK